MFTNGLGPQVKVLKQGIHDENGEDEASPERRVSTTTKPKKEPGRPTTKKLNKAKVKKPSIGKDKPPSTDLQCYFNCDEAFKKGKIYYVFLSEIHKINIIFILK